MIRLFSPARTLLPHKTTHRSSASWLLWVAAGLGHSRDCCMKSVFWSDRRRSCHAIISIIGCTRGKAGRYEGKKGLVVSAFSPEATLKRKIRDHLHKLGFTRGAEGCLVSPSSSKQTIRQLHFEQRKARLKSQRQFVESTLPDLIHFFANGSEIDPAKNYAATGA